VEARLRALLDGELEPGVSRKVLAHLDRCARCQDEHARLKAVSALLQEQELEDVPAHFTASLQVRLASHRRARAASLNRKPRLALPWRWTPRRRWAGALVTAAVTAAFCCFAFSPGIQAAEVARRAELSWMQIRNYGCVFNSRGVYQGEARTFTQRQFFRRPGEFRLDTGQDYPLTTYVKPDRVVHYLPGGDWKGKRGLVIVRPRTDAQEALPFPFGVTWQGGGNVSLDQLVRQLSRNDDAAVVGTERVGDRECYRVRFSAVPPGGAQRDQYELWVDRESFLPRRVSWYRDEQNHIITEAQFLQVNYDVLPVGTFDFQIPEGASVVHGDIDPHVLALPYVPPRDETFDTRPVAAARLEAWKRRETVPFPVLSPRWLPRGFELVRVRRKVGRWLDAHWLRPGAPDASGGNSVVKLVEQVGSAEARADLRSAEQVNLGTRERPILARMRQGTAPYPHVYLSWRQGGTRCTLFAAELRTAQVLRIARSMAEARAPEPPVRTARRGRPRLHVQGEPSVLPTEAAIETAEEPATAETTVAAAAAVVTEQPPMMPEMADDEKPAVDAASAGSATR